MFQQPLQPSAWLVLMAIGFFVGSIPWGLLIARLKGIDIRAHGSGNIGATNVGRVLGRKLGLLCFVLDMLKGAVPVLIAGRVGGLLGEIAIAPGPAAWWLAVMVSPVLGHVLNPWLGFKGGKGVATSLGALLGMYPVLTVPALLAFAVWLAAAIRWKYVSLASLLAAAALPIAAVAYFLFRLPAPGGGSITTMEILLRHATPFVLASMILSGLVFVTHRSNISRLKAGTENRIGHRSRAAATGARVTRSDGERGMPPTA
jgi:acyl phosphate:glycerol-3-phosphate acyltransferase